MIVTGGIAPNASGCVSDHSAKLTTETEVETHRAITRAVHEEGAKICLQILHTGRYAFHKETGGALRDTGTHQHFQAPTS